MDQHYHDRCIANPSMAHTVGNVTFKFTNLLKNMLGPKFFKYVHVDGRMAYKEYAVYSANNTKEFIKKNKPILSIKPVLDIDNDDIFLKQSLLTTNMYGQSFQGIDSFNFLPCFRDIEIGNAINYMMNRIRVIFGVTLYFDTPIEQMNIYSMLLNMFVKDRPYWMRTAIEIMIPHSLIQYLSIESGIPIYDENGSIEKFIRYLNMNSHYRITLKEKTATGKEEFFIYYPLNIEYIFSDFDKSDADKKGFAYYSSEITFSLTTEFNTIGMYEYVAGIGTDVLHRDVCADLDFVNQNVIVPFYTFDNLFTATNGDGWKYFTSRMFKIDDDAGGEDITDLSTMFQDTNVKDIIAYHNRNHIQQDIFFEIKLYKNDKELVLGKDFEFDFDKLTLITKNIQQSATYRFVIYINNDYVTDLMVRLHPEQFKYD